MKSNTAPLLFKTTPLFHQPLPFYEKYLNPRVCKKFKKSKSLPFRKGMEDGGVPAKERFTNTKATKDFQKH